MCLRVKTALSFFFFFESVATKNLMTQFKMVFFSWEQHIQDFMKYSERSIISSNVQDDVKILMMR